MLWRVPSLWCSLDIFPLYVNVQVLAGEEKSVIIFQFLFHISMPLTNLWFIHLEGQFLVLRTRHYRVFEQLIRPPERPLALGREIILNPWFIRSLLHQPSTRFPLLPLSGIGRHFPFSEHETKKYFSNFSNTFKDHSLDIKNNSSLEKNLKSEPET